MAGTTYQDLNNLITTIRESGYLEGRWTTEQSPARGDTKYDHQVEQEEEEEEEEEEKVVPDNGIEANGHHNESNKKMLGQSSTNEPDEPTPVFPKSVVGPTETMPAPAPVKQEPSFNFLQESQIDLESPHMDPAVVMVHPAKRPVQPPGNFKPNIYSESFGTIADWPHLHGNAIIDVEVNIEVKTDHSTR